MRPGIFRLNKYPYVSYSLDEVLKLEFIKKYKTPLESKTEIKFDIENHEMTEISEALGFVTNNMIYD